MAVGDHDNSAGEHDLEKLCKDLENYEMEFSKVIREGKDEFNRCLNKQIDQATERIRESKNMGFT